MACKHSRLERLDAEDDAIGSSLIRKLSIHEFASLGNLVPKHHSFSMKELVTIHHVTVGVCFVEARGQNRSSFDLRVAPKTKIKSIIVFIFSLTGGRGVNLSERLFKYLYGWRQRR